MRSILILILMAAPSAFGASTVTVRSPLSAYEKPDFEAPVLFTVEAGATLVVADKLYGGFRKVKTVVDGRSRIGFVTAAELVAQKGIGKEKKWGAGAGLAYTRLSQEQRQFIDASQIKYSISGYESTDISPVVSFQSGQKNFWRAHLAYKTVSFRGNSVSELGKKEEISIDYKMAALGAQMGWGLFSKIFYAGVGFELAKTISGKVKLGNQDLSGQTEYPDYIGGHIFTGAQLRFGRSLSVFVEGRIGSIPNQDPKLSVIEVAGSLLYWL